MLEIKLRLLRERYPDLPRQAIDYFYPVSKAKDWEEFQRRTLGTFVDTLKTPVDGKPGRFGMPPYDIVRFVLDNLVKGGLLMELAAGAPPMWIASKYFTFAQPDQILAFRLLANFVGYGLPAVLDAYQHSIVQIVARSEMREESGTAFVVDEQTLVTAAHCVSEAPELSIVGLSGAKLEGSRVFISTKDNMDCACVFLAKPLFAGRQFALWNDCNVLDEVVLVGYPSIPTLIGKQIAERATVTSVIRGAIAGTVSDIFHTDLLLISSPARGGFSGGPLLTKQGFVGGMVLRSPTGESADVDRYDSRGYSFAIPSPAIEAFVEAIRNDKKEAFFERDRSTFRWRDA